MSANTTDQQITYPVGTDLANNPLAFTDMLADVETRLVLKYTNEADRTARHTAPVEGDLTGLATENRYDAYDGAAYVSLEARSYHQYLRRTTDAAAINNSAVLVNDAVLVGAVDTGATYQWDCTVFYDSSTVADIKFAFTTPTFSSMRWYGIGLDTGVAGNSGNVKIPTTTASGTSASWGGAAVGTVVAVRMEGFIVTTAAGNIQLQYAQQTADATNTTVRAGSYLRIWRVA